MKIVNRLKFVVRCFLLTVIALITHINFTFSQQVTDTLSCPVKDIGDIIKGKKLSKEGAIAKNYYLFITPVIGSSPATGFVLGAAGQITFKGNGPRRQVFDLINANAQYTSKGQALFQLKDNLLLARNKIFMSGDYRVFIYSQPTYGPGTDALTADKNGGIIIGDASVNPDDIAQEMKYNYYKSNQLAAYNFSGIFYLGG